MTDTGRSLRILLVWPGHSHSTIDIARGYSVALQGLGHEVRNAHLHNWLAFYDVSLKAHRRKIGLPTKEDHHHVMLNMAAEQVAVEIVKFVPDVVLIVCGLALHIAGYEVCYRLGIPVALILTESPYLDAQQVKRCQHEAVKLVFANDRYSVEPLTHELQRLSDSELARAETEERKAAARMMAKPVVYLPHSFDPKRHYPADRTEYKTDVYFFGTLWPERKRLLRPFRRWALLHGVRAKVGSVKPVQKFRPRGLKHNSLLADGYRHTKIALNHNRTIIGVSEDGKEQHIVQAYSLGPRAFEIAACGAFQLCDDTRPELRDVFGDSVATYTDGYDLREKVKWYLAHDKERRDMAWSAFQRVQACAFENRAQEILLPAIREIL